jgi:ribonuclease J
LLKDIPRFVDEEVAKDMPAENVLYLCTGSQGEPRAALMRIAQGDHPTVALDDGDSVVFSSRIIPGNETRIFRLQNLLAERGVRVITEHDHFVHVSGHPCRDELADMYQWTQPQIAVPVHGEMRHLAEHVAFAREMQVPETVLARNGDLVRLAPGAPSIVDVVHAGRLHIDGTMLVAAEDTSVRDRRRIAQAGLIGVTLVVGGDGRLAVAPQVTVNGTPRLAYGAPDGTGDALVDVVCKAAEIAYGALGPRERGDGAAAAEAVRRATRRAAAAMLGKKPITQVQVIRLA